MRFDVAPDMPTLAAAPVLWCISNSRQRPQSFLRRREDPCAAGALALLAENEDHGSYDTFRALSQLQSSRRPRPLLRQHPRANRPLTALYDLREQSMYVHSSWSPGRAMSDDAADWELRTRLERDLTLAVHLPTGLRDLRRYAPASVSCLSRKPTLVPALGRCALGSPSLASRGMPG